MKKNQATGLKQTRPFQLDPHLHSYNEGEIWEHYFASEKCGGGDGKVSEEQNIVH